jgi:hypothetical protein
VNRGRSRNEERSTQGWDDDLSLWPSRHSQGADTHLPMHDHLHKVGGGLVVAAQVSQCREMRLPN